jgi:hypothetical protein
MRRGSRRTDALAPVAVRIDKPDSDFQPDSDFDDSQLNGEMTTSNMTMESLAQKKSPNCFSRHTTHGTDQMPASRLNVSHAILKFTSGQ